MLTKQKPNEKWQKFREQFKEANNHLLKENTSSPGRPKASPLASSISKAYSPTNKLTREEIVSHNSFGFIESIRKEAHKTAPKLFSKPQSAEYSAKEFFYLHNKLQKQRDQINDAIKNLKASIIDHPNSAKCARLYTKLNQEILLYHDTKQQIHELYKKYHSFNHREKENYWKRVTGYENVAQTIELFERMDQLLQSPQGERFDTLDLDFYLAFHNKQGQELIAEFLMGLAQYNVDFTVKHGNAIQVEPTPKEGFDLSDLSARTGWNYNDLDAWGNLSVDEFFIQLQKQMIPGRPEALGNITLAYAQQGSVPFGYTIDKDGFAQSYLIETYVTFLHELGHAAAILRGDFFDNNAPLPQNLMHYHQLEEFLNIRFRRINEASLDPLGIQRVGHTGIEFESLNNMKLSDLTDRWGESFLIERTQMEAEDDLAANAQLQETGVTWKPTKLKERYMENDVQQQQIAQQPNITTDYREIMSELNGKTQLNNEAELDGSLRM